MLTFGLLTSCSDDDSETTGNEDDKMSLINLMKNIYELDK